jgi:hypothetical protein
MEAGGSSARQGFEHAAVAPAVVLVLLIAVFWLLGVLRRMIARSRPQPQPPAEGLALSGRERRT